MLTGIKNVAPVHRRRLVRSRVFTKHLSYKCFWGPKTFWWFNFKCFSPYMGINLLGLWFLTSYLWNFLELSLVVGFTLSFRCVRQQPRPPCHLGLPWFALLSLFRLGPAQSDIMVPGSACTHHPARLPPGRRDSAWRTRFPPTPTGANSPGASAIDTDDRNLKPNNIMTRYDNLMTTFTTMKWNSFIDWRSPTINDIRSVRLMAWTRTHAECLAKSSQCLQEIRRQYSRTADLQWWRRSFEKHIKNNKPFKKDSISWHRIVSQSFGLHPEMDFSETRVLPIYPLV